MKRIISAISALAVMAGFSASCKKEMVPDNNSASVNTGLTITATIADNGTKVSYAEDASHNLTPTWVVDDIIIGFDGNDKTYGYKVTAVNEGVATLARIMDGDFKGSATSDPADGTEMYMIYAPGYKPTDISSKSLTVSLASQSKDVVPALMMAQATVANSSLNLAFKNQTAIIGIKTPTMAIASKTYTGIAVSGAGINTEVKFGLNASSQLEATYQTPGTIVKAMGSITSGTDKSTSATIYVVACPLETAADLTFTASNGEFFKQGSRTMAAGQYYYMTPTFIAPVALSGVFTVGTDGSGNAKTVRFSQGNLRCYPIKTAGTYTSGVWGFFDNQYDRGPSLYSDGHDKEISFFTWGYNATKSIVPDGCADDNVNITSGNLSQEQDWGSQIGDGNTWRTLTTAEWQYLFNTSADASSKVGFATVGGVEGIIILPDTFTDPMKNGGSAAFAPKSTTGWSANVYTTGGNWEAMETAGAVFLPAAGYREDSEVINIGYDGYYWSSTALDGIRAYYVDFDSSDVYYPDPYGGRFYGYSVRLITESN